MPPAFRNNLGPTAGDTPALSAASSLLDPAAIACQNLSCAARPATGGRPSEGSGARVDRFLRMVIATSKSRVLRRPIESADYPAEPVVTAACFFCCTGAMGIRRSPAFPAPSYFRGLENDAQLGQIMSRERGFVPVACYFEATCVFPAVQVGQYRFHSSSKHQTCASPP